MWSEAPREQQSYPLKEWEINKATLELLKAKMHVAVGVGWGRKLENPKESPKHEENMQICTHKVEEVWIKPPTQDEANVPHSDSFIFYTSTYKIRLYKTKTR